MRDWSYNTIIIICFRHITSWNNEWIYRVSFPRFCVFIVNMNILIKLRYECIIQHDYRIK